MNQAAHGGNATNGSAMIEAVNLSKYYGDFAATRDVSFTIDRGEVVAFLGPNGAGKSTTMKLLTGYLAPSTGTARIAGYDTATDRLAASRQLGYLPENGPLYPDMTPRSMLRFSGEIQGMSSSAIDQRMREVIELCRMLGSGQLNQSAAQAAAWHFTDDLTWIELVNKIGARHLNGTVDRYFHPNTVRLGMRYAQVAAQRAKLNPSQVDKIESLSNQ